MPKVQVDSEEWLEYILNKHTPKVTDIGDQRDPQDVIICTCGKLKATWSNYKEPLYAKHLKEILENQYFQPLFSDMR